MLNDNEYKTFMILKRATSRKLLIYVLKILLSDCTCIAQSITYNTRFDCVHLLPDACMGTLVRLLTHVSLAGLQN